MSLSSPILLHENHQTRYKAFVDYLLQNPIYYQLVIASALGALIGLERQLAGKDPGLRTFTLISLGSCVFGILSIEIAGLQANGDPGRIAAQVVSGVGFLGAGVIFGSGGRVVGLTSAAFIWLTASIGLAVGFHHIELAVATAVTASVANVILTWVNRRLWRRKRGSATLSKSKDD